MWKKKIKGSEWNSLFRKERKKHAKIKAGAVR